MGNVVRWEIVQNCFGAPLEFYWQKGIQPMLLERSEEETLRMLECLCTTLP